MSLKTSKLKKDLLRQVKSETKKSFSNKGSKLHIFLTSENTYSKFELTYVPYNTILYQGTDFNFNENSKIEEYYNYYNKRHRGAYFLSSYNIASIYGINKDYSHIIYITIHTLNEIKNQINRYKYIYPLYYIKGYKGTNIKYTLNKNLKLIDIGNIKNIEYLWFIIISLNISNDKKKKYIELLYDTIAKITSLKDIYDKPPTIAERNSIDTSDDDLVLFFKKYIIIYFKKNYNIELDGWIYYNNSVLNNFHDEILLFNNSALVYKSKERLSNKIYNNIPTLEEFMKSMESKKINNNSSIKYNTILSNYCNVLTL